MFVSICIRKNGLFIPFYLQTAHIEDFHHNTTQSKCNIHTHLLQTQLQTTIDRSYILDNLIDRQIERVYFYFFFSPCFDFCFFCFELLNIFGDYKHSVMKICSYNNEIFKHFQWIGLAKHCHCICSDGVLSADWSHW